MKKIAALLFAIIMLFSLAACGTRSNPQTTKNPQSYLADKKTEQAKPDADSDSVTDDTQSESSNDPGLSTEYEQTEPESNSGLGSDFKAAMDSYENFMDEYVAFMKKYAANPSDWSLLADYMDFMTKYAEFVEEFDKWENEDLNADELAYYIEVQARVTKKLLEVAQ